MMDFKRDFVSLFPALLNVLQSNETKEWIIKGFIDTYRKIYPMNDTKVISKLIEIILLPYLDKFAKINIGLCYRIVKIITPT